MEYTDELINLLLNNKNIVYAELDYTIMELKKSLYSDWMMEKSIQQINIELLNSKSNSEQMISKNNFIHHISNGIKTSNILNEYNQDLIYDDNFYNTLNNLYNFGVIFDTKFNSEYEIKINSREILFPICCVGKNRSQYLFYYLKYLESMYPNHF